MINSVTTLVPAALRSIKIMKPVYPLEVRIHKTIGGAECYRLVDSNGKPIINISKPVALSLIKKNVIKGLPAQKPRNGELF